MARIRSVHHEIALDDRLAECSWPARMLAVLLPTIADRKGRLRDNPKQIKAQMFPFDDALDVNAALDELAAVGRIERYNVNGTNYIQIANWDEQQRPHIREAASTIPGPCTVCAEHNPRLVPSTDPAPTQDGAEPAGLRSLVFGLGDLGQGEGDCLGAPPLRSVDDKTAVPSADRAATFVRRFGEVFAEVMGCPWTQDPRKFVDDLERLFGQRHDVDRVVAVAREHLISCKAPDPAYPYDDTSLGNVLRNLAETERRCVQQEILPRLTADGTPEKTWKDRCRDEYRHKQLCRTPSICQNLEDRIRRASERARQVEAAGGEESFRAQQREQLDSLWKARKRAVAS